MAKLPPIRRIQSENYPDLKWMPRLASDLNLFMESVTDSLNRNLTLGENLAAEIRTVTVDGNWPVKLSWTLPYRPSSVVVGNVVRSDGSSFTLASAVQVQWSFNQAGQLQLDGIAGITPTESTKYRITIEVKTS